MNPDLSPFGPNTKPESLIDLVIEAKTRELAEGFKVRRVLPHVKRRMIGPFIFFDEMGPEILAAGKGLDVAPHPHIGLATVTYLFKGEIMHRDSLGNRQLIAPGEVNWMTAGRGIAHSERTPREARVAGGELFGIQTWIALPASVEECDPSFFHFDAAGLPSFGGEGKTVKLIAGSLFGKTSPVKTFSDMFYADAELMKGVRLEIPAEHAERAVFVAEGKIEFLPVGGTFHAGQLAILRQGYAVTITGLTPAARVMLFGGEPFGETRHIWWNFVSSSKERIEQAKADWKEQRFGQIADEKEFIPLPADTRPAGVRYP